MKVKLKTIGFLSIAAVLLAIPVLWLTGVLGLWINGMAYIANDTKAFSDASGSAMPGEYTVSINLADLKSNIGKELYHDGSSRIYVGWVDNTGSANTGGYRIGFRSCGQYSLSGATLVSGARHETVGEQSFSTDMTADMTAKYNGKVYNSGIFGTSGLNYQDGDDFSFYIFPAESYQNGEITLNEGGTVELTVTNLYKNVWTKK